MAPSTVAAAGEIWTDDGGMQPLPTPRALETEQVARVIDEFATAVNNAVRAGFDGVELHGANGYLIEQFLNPGPNRRTDAYGRSIDNRNRFAIEVAAAVAAAIGELGLAYIHLVNYERVGETLNRALKGAFGGTVIVNGGLDRKKAKAALAAGLGDLRGYIDYRFAQPA